MLWDRVTGAGVLDMPVSEWGKDLPARRPARGQQGSLGLGDPSAPGPGGRGSLKVAKKGGQVWEISGQLAPQPSVHFGVPCALALEEEAERPRLNPDPRILSPRLTSNPSSGPDRRQSLLHCLCLAARTSPGPVASWTSRRCRWLPVTCPLCSSPNPMPTHDSWGLWGSWPKRCPLAAMPVPA